MTISLSAAFAAADWPTLAQMRQSLEAEGLPIELMGLNEGPLAAAPGNCIHVRFQGSEIILESEIVRIDAENTYAVTYEEEPEVDKTDDDGIRFTISTVSDVPIPRSINKDLAKLGAEGVQFGEGDVVLTLSAGFFDKRSIWAAMAIIGCMVKAFKGYGFEFQSNMHGGAQFGEMLIKQAMDNAS